jgi:hypothetical protein
MDINAAYREVGSYRAAAKLCGTTPKTVRRAVAAAEAEATGPAPAVALNYDTVADIVAERVTKTNGLISAKRLLPSARAAGYVGVSPRQIFGKQGEEYWHRRSPIHQWLAGRRATETAG